MRAGFTILNPKQDRVGEGRVDRFAWLVAFRLWLAAAFRRPANCGDCDFDQCYIDLASTERCRRCYRVLRGVALNEWSQLESLMATLPPIAMSKNDDDGLIALFDAGLEQDCGDAARAHLQAGRPVHYVEQGTPKGHVIRAHPNGSRELLRVDVDGSTHVICGI